MEPIAHTNTINRVNSPGRMFKWYKGTNRDVALGLFILLSICILFFKLTTQTYIDANNPAGYDNQKSIIKILFLIGLSGAVLYWFSVEKIIPALFKKGKNNIIYYYQRVILILLISILPTDRIVSRIGNFPSYIVIPVFLFNAGFQLIVIAPLAWVVYLNRNEMSGLKIALKRSSANLDMLRAQINPHFLFNALNTLYGTALQENADRSGEGIQKLGDMMRFMLQENMQDKISLTREVDYLQNYISLQKLRTQVSADIIIQAGIDEQVNNLHIAPMLLIPFIENAFKHGISLRSASYIKISLHTVADTLYFDVQNSVHEKTNNDPEKNNSGIGLLNVEQRLQLLYTGRYELNIHETAKEFFVHLTLQLV